MTLSPRFFWSYLKDLLHVRVPFPRSKFGLLMAALSALGIFSLGYLWGAAVMFFALPSSDFLDEAFTGAKAWQERGRSTIPTLPPDAAGHEQTGQVAVDKAEKTCDGFTLYTLTEAARATLIDMRGNIVHRWQLPFSAAYPHPTHVKTPLADDQIHWFRCHLYPNGDLLAIYHADGDTPYGYGLVKLDKDSKPIWAYPGRVHHDLDVAEDGTIHTLVQHIVHHAPAELEYLPMPCLDDSLVVLSPGGRELKNLSLLEAFAHSSHALLLASVYQYSRAGTSKGGRARSSTLSSAENDLLHTNSVKVLSQALASKFPLFQARQVLLSIRNLGLLAVLDLSTRRIVWAVPGIWRQQHDAEFLDNGHLLLYDNLGARQGIRILEYDPQTQAIPWVYNNENPPLFNMRSRGMKQHLRNGNTLIVDPDRRLLFEVTPGKELVWENYCPSLLDSPGLPSKAHAVTSARRYSPDELTFLKGRVSPRPRVND